MLKDIIQRDPQRSELWGPQWIALVPYFVIIPLGMVVANFVSTGPVIGFAFMLSWLVSNCYQVWHFRRLRRKLRESDGRVCKFCKHSLKVLASPPLCPGCGHAYPADGYASHWRDVYKGVDWQMPLHSKPVR